LLPWQLFHQCSQRLASLKSFFAALGCSVALAVGNRNQLRKAPVVAARPQQLVVLGLPQPVVLMSLQPVVPWSPQPAELLEQCRVPV
jgi:hypothetical protein